MKFPVKGMTLILLLTGAVAGAQSPDNGSTAAASAKAVPPTAAPGSGSATEKKKPKKVWTNEDMGSVKGTISVVGDGSGPSNGSAKEGLHSDSKPGANKQIIENYRNQIQEYQSQIDAIEQRIHQLKNFKAEDASPAGGIHPNQAYNMVPVEEQVKQLEEKRKQLQGKIEDAEIAAKKDGIDPGDLR